MPAAGKLDLIPQLRDYELQFYGVEPDSLETRELETSYDDERRILTVKAAAVEADKGLTIRFRPEASLSENNLAAFAYKAINRAQIPFASKEKLYRVLTGDSDRLCKLSTMEAMVLPEEMKSVIRELLLAD